LHSRQDPRWQRHFRVSPVVVPPDQLPENSIQTLGLSLSGLVSLELALDLAHGVPRESFASLGWIEGIFLAQVRIELFQLARQRSRDEVVSRPRLQSVHGGAGASAALPPDAIAHNSQRNNLP